jgi:exopolyphosphatase/guanosine-5'-triphosphate,3'-diphosphate pyrophosphatase
VQPEVYEQLLRSYDEGVAEFLDLERVKPNTLGNTRMLLFLQGRSAGPGCLLGRRSTVGGVARVAAIDCGTNSVRLLVADLPSDRAEELTDVVRRMEIVRLGQGVDRTGSLAPEAIERTRGVLADYAAQIADLGVPRTRMVATSATRDAANADEFRVMVERTLGVAPEVVTGDEEARLTFAGAVRGLPPSTPAPYLVLDIGGGSTEFVLGQDRSADAVQLAVSVDVGCVRMTERHLHDDPPTPEQIRAAEADIGSIVDAALAVVPGRSARTLVGVAGSVTTVTALALDLDAYRPDRIHHATVAYRDVARVTAELLAMTRAKRLALPVMHPGRADVIGAGALILRVVMQRVGAGSVVASEHDILDGIAWSLADRD